MLPRLGFNQGLILFVLLYQAETALWDYKSKIPYKGTGAKAGIDWSI